MPEVKLITPPDSIHDSNKSILLINFNDTLKEGFNKAMTGIDYDVNIYLYDFERMLNEQWLIATISFVDNIVINTEGLDGHWLLGYILSKSKTFYFAPDNGKQPYKLLNANRIYSFEEASKIFVKKTEPALTNVMSEKLNNPED
tara:strand:- start:253 stop:684 length:432 start_codon:yes stop_codon:yes gene_type:complete